VEEIHGDGTDTALTPLNPQCNLFLASHTPHTTPFSISLQFSVFYSFKLFLIKCLNLAPVVLQPQGTLPNNLPTPPKTSNPPSNKQTLISPPSPKKIDLVVVPPSPSTATKNPKPLPKNLPPNPQQNHLKTPPSSSLLRRTGGKWAIQGCLL
jgi:hypothetical protein